MSNIADIGCATPTIELIDSADHVNMHLPALSFALSSMHQPCKIVLSNTMFLLYGEVAQHLET